MVRGGVGVIGPGGRFSANGQGLAVTCPREHDETAGEGVHREEGRELEDDLTRVRAEGGCAWKTSKEGVHAAIIAAAITATAITAAAIAATAIAWLGRRPSATGGLDPSN